MWRLSYSEVLKVVSSGLSEGIQLEGEFTKIDGSGDRVFLRSRTFPRFIGKLYMIELYKQPEISPVDGALLQFSWGLKLRSPPIV